MSSRWQGATVLVTGGTGFFGQHFLEYALESLDLRAIRVYSRDEHKQHDLRQRWSDVTPGSRVTYVVGDVRDAARLARACHGVDVIVHTAALKRVEGSATHAREFVKTNVLGTANVVDAALDNNVPYTVFLSSDKAALATNCYGKSKALAEDLVIEGNGLAGGKQKFSCVRYGNVLGSTGSVLSLWEAARKADKPLPITRTDMTRFWITVQEAIQTVLETVEALQGGEIVVPKMLRSTLTTLVQAIYPDKYPSFEANGERAGGEKLAETILGTDEARHTTEFCGSYVIHPQLPVWNMHYQQAGDPLPLGFTLSSDTPPLASVEEMRTLLKRAGLLPEAVPESQSVRLLR